MENLPVGYASRKLLDQERNYSAIEECLACSMGCQEVSTILKWCGAD